MILVPGVVVGYVPYRVLTASPRLLAPPPDAVSLGAAVLLALGTAVLLRCVRDFAAAGRGTLVPIDPPRNLVVRGLFRFTRNPMYNGVTAVLLWEAALFRSWALLRYGLLVFAVFHFVVLLYEEPNLTRRFGDAYEKYRSAVPRWGFVIHGYRG